MDPATTHPLELPLRDIHLPANVSWWPPAPGWWFLAGLMIILMIVVAAWYRRRQRLQMSAIKLARKELEELRDKYQQDRDSQQLIREISILLRRLNISIYPRKDTAGLIGSAWLQHLDQSMQGEPFTSGAGKILVDAPYRRDIQIEEIEPLVKLCTDWIDAVVAADRRLAA